MSYLKFRSLKFVGRADVESRLFAWPVYTIPIRFWGVVPNQLDILERALLGLVEAGVRKVDDVRALLGISETMREMVQRSSTQLQARGFLDRNLRITPDGRDVLHETNTPFRQYQQGWLFYDRIRGKMFPFVQTKPLQFFLWKDMQRFAPIELQPKIHRPELADLMRQGAEAVASYNRYVQLLDANDDDESEAGLLERELDLPITTQFASREVEDIEILSPDLIEEHNIVIEITGRAVPGRLKPELTSYSPFSPWEQDRYLRTIEQLNIPRAAQALTEFCARLEFADDTIFMEGLPISADDLWQTVDDEFARWFGDAVSFSDELLEKLEWAEFNYQKAHATSESGPSMQRNSLFNDWGILLETSVKTLAQEFENQPVPKDWPKKGMSKKKAWEWYCALVEKSSRSGSWIQLPPRLRHNLQRRVIPPTLKSQKFTVRGASSNDSIAIILLATVLKPDSMIPPKLLPLVTNLDQGVLDLHAMDMIVGYRNDAAHGGRDYITKMSDEELRNAISQVREAALTFLKIVFSTVKVDEI